MTDLTADAPVGANAKADHRQGGGRGHGRRGAAVEGALAIGVACLVFAVCWLSIVLPDSLRHSVPVWPANAIIIVLLLGNDPRRWKAWLAASWAGDFAASLVAHESLLLAAVLSGCNILTAAVSVYGLRRLTSTGELLTTLAGLLRFIVVAGVVAPLMSAVVAGLTLGGLDSPRTWRLLVSWAAANSLGALILVPMLLILANARQYLKETPVTRRGAAAVAVMVGVTIIVTRVDYVFSFVVFPVLLLTVFELEFLGAALCVLVLLVAGADIVATGRAYVLGRLASADEMVLVIQLFLASVTLMALPTAMALAGQRRLRQAVIDSETRYRLVTEASHDLVIKIDPAGRIQFASRASQRFGFDPDELLGRPARQIAHAEDADRWANHIESLWSIPAGVPDAGRVEFRLQDARGRAIWVESNPGVIRDEAGRPSAVTSTLRDIGVRKSIEAELRASQAAAEAAAAAKAEFLANISHELRTPLTSVLGFSRLTLHQTDLSATSRDYMRKVVNASTALLAIINDVLDFSKLESGRFQTSAEPSNPLVLLQDTVELFSEAAAAKRLDLRLDTGSLPTTVEIDPDRFKQLLLNLIGNAVKFSDRGAVIVKARWCADTAVLEVRVIDQGPGIPLAEQTKLFHRFSQLDDSSTRRHGGTGLGLAICHGLVTAMGGEIGVDSAPGDGAAFWFTLPAPLATAGSAPAQEIIPAFDTGLRVLIADDHRANRELVSAILAPLGIDVHEAVNGREAVRVASEKSFDLVLMDLLMPELDGLSAMQEIRSGAGPNRRSPILAFSAAVDTQGADQRRLAGFDGDLPKPVLPETLLSAINQFVVQGTH